MKTRILIVLTALGLSLGGCYTSFASREYEEESFGQVEESPTVDTITEQPDSMIVFQNEDGSLDTVYLYTGNSTEVNDNPNEEVTIVNNYYDGTPIDDGFIIGGFFGFPTFYAPVPYYSWYNPYFYDPFYYNYYPPYYSYYGPSIYVYGDYYAGYYNGGTYYPSEERYRSNRSHWTNLRNNDGGRRVSRKSRDSYRTLPVASRGGANDILSSGINLDREMQKISTSRRKTELASLNKGGIRKANLEVSERVTNRKSEAKTVSSRSPKKIVKREAVQQTKPKRTSREAKYSRQNTNRKRAYTKIQNKSSYGKRKNKTYRKSYNSSVREATRSSKRSGSSKSYKRQRTSRSSGKSYNSNSSRSSYKSNSSRRSRSSSSYSGSRSSSRSSYKGSSSRSSSRSSYSGSSGRSSSPSSHSSSRSSSGRSSSSRSGGRRR